MKINYANNPLLGIGKWDALLSLLTPDGDGVIVPERLVGAIAFRASQLKKQGLAIFRISKNKSGNYLIERFSEQPTRGNCQLHKKILNLKAGGEPLLVSKSEFQSAYSFAMSRNKSDEVKYRTSGQRLDVGKVWRVK